MIDPVIRPMIERQIKALVEQEDRAKAKAKRLQGELKQANNAWNSLARSIDAFRAVLAELDANESPEPPVALPVEVEDEQPSPFEKRTY